MPDTDTQDDIDKIDKILERLNELTKARTIIAIEKLQKEIEREIDELNKPNNTIESEKAPGPEGKS
jgi:ferritin-like metal-binding protein YciE